MEPARPDPDRLLARISRETDGDVARAGRRGRLKVFFGFAAGVGKTYAMLQEAHALRSSGRDVVVGWIEPHGRPETEALAAGLPTVPPRIVEHRGLTLSEPDIEALLARHPSLVLIDELAHTNAPGSRHARRWQDVEDLLEAGCDVHATLNVQHIESLNDVVASITGVTVRETLPDEVFESADEVELIDLSPDELLERLRAGKVYMPEAAERALQGFFRRPNLVALRELSLRRTADRVNAEVLDARAAAEVATAWPTRERVLACVGPSTSGPQVVRAARRLARALRADFSVVTVETPFGRRLSAREREQLAATRHIAELLGAETVKLEGSSVPEELLSYARDVNATRLVVGAPKAPRWLRLFAPSPADLLAGAGTGIELQVVDTSRPDEAEAPPADGRRRGEPPFAEPAGPGGPRGWRIAAGAVLMATLLAAGLDSVGLAEANVVMVYLLGVAFVAARCGRAPAIAASIASVLFFDLIFVPPAGTLAVEDTQYLVTFVVMAAIAMLIGRLTARLREQVAAGRERERRTEALWRMSAHLSETTGTLTLAHVALQQLARAFGTQVALLLPDERGGLQPVAGAPAPFLAADEASGVARWVLEHGQPAGQGTDTLPGVRAHYVPLIVAHGVRGVLAVVPPERVALGAPEQRQFLQTLANQVALALERDAFERRAHDAQVAVETERLRSALLSAVSHDLRTPLAVIIGASGELLSGRVSDPARRDGLLRDVHAEATRLARLVANLLEMTRLQSGGMQPRREWLPLEELVGSALAQLGERLRDRAVETDLPPDLPMVPVDGLLVEQVLINLLENAAKHTGPASPIGIRARAGRAADGREQVEVEVLDRGPGFAQGDAERAFEKFWRQGPGAGAGLGLAISRGIVEAHGGRIVALPREGGGSVLRFSLPLDALPAPADDAPA